MSGRGATIDRRARGAIWARGGVVAGLLILASDAALAASPVVVGVAPPQAGDTDAAATAALAALGPGLAVFSVAELILLANALENRGEPLRAIAVMDKFRFNFADHPEFWARLATLYENNCDFDKALSCLQEVSRLQGTTVADGLRQARLLCNLLRPAGALARLVALRGKASESDYEYWSLLGDLAWRLENYPQAVEAYALIWKNYKTEKACQRLVMALQAAGRSHEAVGVAVQGHQLFGANTFFETAIDIAVGAGLIQDAKALFAETRGHEEQFDQRPEFWLQRGILEISAEDPAAAERDLQRALALDPDLEPAQFEWLRLAVQTRDRAMAARAVRAWTVDEPSIDQASLMAEAYALLGDRAQSRHFGRLRRLERARELADPRHTLTTEERLDRAIELGDRASIERDLGAGGDTLSLSLRVAALRELGRDHEAWTLIDGAGLTGAEPESEDALALGADIRSLRESHLDGLWSWLGMDTLGSLSERDLGARFELRTGGTWFLGAKIGVAHIDEPADRHKAIPGADAEQSVALTARRLEARGETSLQLGTEFLPEGMRVHGQAGQRLRLWAERLDLNLTGVWGEVPRHSVLLRMAGLRDGIDLDVNAKLAGPLELAATLTYSRFSTRAREFLTTEKAAQIEIGFHLPFRDLFLRPRIDGFANRVPALRDTIPDGLAPLLIASDSTDDLLALQYASTGLGLTLASTNGDVGEGGDPRMSLRYRLDGWGGYVWPTAHPSYAFNAAIGLVFARHQELSVHGLYAADFRNAKGQSYWGGTVNYTLRWFR